MYYAAIRADLCPRLLMLDPCDIERRLSTYLDAPVARLSILASGWETTVFEFTLEAPSKSFAADPGRPADGVALLPGLGRRRQRRARAHDDRSPVRRTLSGAASLRLRGRPSRAGRAVPHHAAARRRPAVRRPQFPECVQNFLAGIFFLRSRAIEASQIRSRERRPARDSARLCARSVPRAPTRRCSIASSR